MNSNFDKTAIYQLSSESQGTIHMFDVVIKPFLKRFGVEEENWLSIFCRYFLSKKEIKHELELFFSKSIKTSNNNKIVHHSNSDQEIIN